MTLPKDQTPDPAQTLRCWHATTQPFAERILAEGLIPREGRIYTSLHPYWPIVLKRDQTRRFTLMGIELPLTGSDAWSFGTDFGLGAWETFLRRPVAAAHIVDRVDGDDDCAWPRFAGARGAARCQPLPALAALDGYDGWFSDPALFSQRCQELALGPDGNRAALAAVYLNHFQPVEESAAMLRRVASGLAHAIVASPTIHPGSLRAIADVLNHKRIDWVGAALQIPLAPLPLPRLALSVALARFATTSAESRDALLRRLRDVLPAPQARRFAAVCGLMQGVLPSVADLADADTETMDAMIDVVRLGQLGTVRGKSALDAIERLPTELADTALLELLRHRRAVPSRARRHLDRKLKRRVPRITPTLTAIANETDGRPRQVARWLLGDGRS